MAPRYLAQAHKRTSLCRKNGAEEQWRRRGSSSLNSPAVKLAPSPFLLPSTPFIHACATGAASRLFLRQGFRLEQQMHEMRFLQKLASMRRQKKETACARFLCAGAAWNNSAHYARRYCLPNHTHQRPHCVDYLVNLLMPLSSIAGVNVPGFFCVFFPSPSLSLCLSSFIGEV